MTYTMKHKILIADDEQRMRILISDFLSAEGFDVIEAKDGNEALEHFYNDPDIHLILLDVMMPGQDGWEVCSAIRLTSQVPIIMLTAKSSEQDELTGFKNGSDEYITKPFRPAILVARVKALINRVYGSEELTSYGSLTIDYGNHTVMSDNQPIKLSLTEFNLLTYLIQNKGHLLSREQLLNNVWGYDYDGTDRTVDSHMNRLRSKLLESGSYLHTIRGYGYKFEVME